MTSKGEYRIGRSIVDVTTSFCDFGNGYFKFQKKEGGIHSRLFSRAFFIEHIPSKSKFVHVTIDYQFVPHSIKTRVVELMVKKFGKEEFGHENICICGNNSFSSPIGGLSWYNIFNFHYGGYDAENSEILSKGIFKSVKEAIKGVSKGGHIYFGESYVGNQISCNSSPNYYAGNPSIERGKLAREVKFGQLKDLFLEREKSDTKKNEDKRQSGKKVGRTPVPSSVINGVTQKLTLLKFVNEKKQLLGVICWFPIHCCSLGANSKEICSEILGYSSILFEKYIFYQRFGYSFQGIIGKKKTKQEKIHQYFPGIKRIKNMHRENENKSFNFVASFANSNCADVSPNYHVNFGRNPCGYFSHDLSNRCGPGKTAFESLESIAKQIFHKALLLCNVEQMKSTENDQIFSVGNHLHELNGPIRSVLKFINFKDQKIDKKYLPKPQTREEATNESVLEEKRTVSNQSIGNFQKLKFHYDYPVDQIFQSIDKKFQPILKPILKEKLAKNGKKRSRKSKDMIQKRIDDEGFETLLNNNQLEQKCSKKGKKYDGIQFFPENLPLQIIMIGEGEKQRKKTKSNGNKQKNSFTIIGAPTEFTTIAGKRVERIIKKELRTGKKKEKKEKKEETVQEEHGIIVQSFSNGYGFHTCTPEEYNYPVEEDENNFDTESDGQQSFEACMMLFGKFTLSYYLQEYSMLSKSFNQLQPNKFRSLIGKIPSPPQLFLKKKKKNFKELSLPKLTLGIKTEPEKFVFYNIPVLIEFFGSDPRNLQVEKTFITIERKMEKKSKKKGIEEEWKVIKKESSVDTIVSWKKEKGGSVISVVWTPRFDCLEGFYRCRYFASYQKLVKKEKVPFILESQVFRLISTSENDDI